MQTFENNAWYAIAAKAGGKVITAEGKDNGAPISIEENQDKASQLWSITAEGDYYKIVNKESGKALDVVSLGTANGTYLHQWDFAGGKSQLWKIEERDNGALVIRSALSGKCVDIVGMASDTDGAKLQIWENTDGENQQWLTFAKTEEKPAEQANAEPEKTEEKPAEQAKAEPEKTEEKPAEQVNAEPEKTEEKPAEQTASVKEESKAKTAAKKTASTRSRKTTGTKKSTRKATGTTKRTRKTKAQREAEAAAAKTAETK